jgi:CBS domain-containing protein
MTETPLAAALAQMVGERIGALPVVDESARLAGLITEQDLLWRGGLRLQPRLLRLLSPEEGAAFLAPLSGRVAHEVMSAEPRSVVIGTAIPKALMAMIEWGYAQIPVVERDGRLAGLLGPEQILRESVAQAQGEAGAVRDAEPPTPVRLVMQTAAHQLYAGAPLDGALAQLVATPSQSLPVLDAAGRLGGVLSTASALRGLVGAARAAFLAALQRPQMPGAGPSGAAQIPPFESEQRLEELIERDPPTIGPELSVLDAARRLLELEAEQLAVVDGEAKLLGIIGRGGLIRALLQQSE